jgi:tRNA-dihydrouridine synthase
MISRSDKPTRIVALAPMEGVSDVPFRLWLALVAPPAEMGTPFLRVTRTYPQAELPPLYAPELVAWRGLLPYRLVPQMMAAAGDDFLRAADLFGDTTPFIDLNCGCPAPICVGKGAGSAILRDAAAFRRRVERLATTLGAGRLSVKMRLGFDSSAEFPPLLDALRGLPLARLTVHGRTRAEGYRGVADWMAIAAASDTLAPLPVLASGDVVDAPSHSRLIAAAPKTVGTLVGRGALRNPFVFAELRGGDTTLPTAMIAPALAAYALLNELKATAPEALARLVATGVFLQPLGTNADGWSTFCERLAALLGGSEPSRAALGRAKMLWNYWRSSLPATFYAPQTLRAPTLGAMTGAIAGLAKDHGVPFVTPRHRPELDRFYAGGKSAESDPAPTAPRTPAPSTTAASVAAPQRTAASWA